MGLKEANIYLDNQLNTFYAGQTINGRIEYVFDSPKKVRGIQVQFKGEAHTEWYESKQQENEQGKTESNDTTHTGNEEYFQVSYYVLGSSNGNEIEIPAGKQVYNFTCTLPPVLPSSFEGEYGYVRYTVKVTLDRPWKFNQDTKMAFTVINALDLNLNPSYREPIHIQMEKTFCCFCCASPPLSVDVLAPVSGYCPGQVIPITVNIENKSNVQVHLVKIFLRKVVTYRASSGASKKTKDIILTVQEGPAPAGSTKHWNLNMEIPPIPPSNLVNCNIIDLDYDFKVECVVSGMHINLKDKKYITIGTVPLVGMPGQGVPAQPSGQYSPGQPAVLPVGPGQPALPSAPPAPNGGGEPTQGWVMPGQPPYQGLYPTLTEPVYKESQYTARTIQDRGDNEHTMIRAPQFAPYYPTYAAVQPPPLPQ
ncbi:arrestin domain-containing protein 17 [Amyelois transitella]|uniref:arrestin domain-containing protein 17 n=1 Tax=Amyelois transitella TaxID=680683 RepID=UPI00067D6321|nr:arrestin domain-containing protein 17 [Amyelois transitella]